MPETGVFGCDSVITARHDGKLFWLWGDTTLPGYPLGVFQSTAATTPLAPLKTFEPPLALPFTYFRDDKDSPRGVANIPGEGPTWLTAMISFPDNHLVATYSKIKGYLTEYEVGLCRWDATTQHFLSEKVLWKMADGVQPLLLKGHPVRWQDSAGKRWLLFGDPFPAAPRSAADGSEIQPHRGCIAWNAYRKRWVAIFTQHSGKPSAFGEIWHAEAESPLGPWSATVKVFSHDNHTFCNPRIQTDLTPENAPFILFEGTCTAEFADHARPTPRYNHNQILYRLDLDDSRLKGGK